VPRGAVDQREAVEQESRGERSEQEILERPSAARGLERRNAVIAYAPMLMVSSPRNSVSASPAAASVMAPTVAKSISA
jgi:hypothetical protein